MFKELKRSQKIRKQFNDLKELILIDQNSMDPTKKSRVIVRGSERKTLEKSDIGRVLYKNRSENLKKKILKNFIASENPKTAEKCWIFQNCYAFSSLLIVTWFVCVCTRVLSRKLACVLCIHEK